MQLTYDDEERVFGFTLDNPVTLGEEIDFFITLPQGLSGFARAYSISKYFEESSGFAGSLYSATEALQVEPLREELKKSILSSRQYIDTARSDYDSGAIPESVFTMLTEDALRAIESAESFMVKDRDTLIEKLVLVSVDLEEDAARKGFIIGHGGFSLPGVGEILITAPFTFTLTSLGEREEQAMVEKTAQKTIH